MKVKKKKRMKNKTLRLIKTNRPACKLVYLLWWFY